MADDATPYVHQEWPKWLYDKNGVGTIFNSADDVPDGEWFETQADAAAELAATSTTGEIPADWKDLHWKRQAAIAEAITGEKAPDGAAAQAAIQAELDKRAAATAGAQPA